MRSLLLACALWLSAAAWAEDPLRIITPQHRFATDLLPAIQPLVGDGGTASVAGQHLLIRTSPERMLEIERVIAQLDVAQQNLRITVRRNQTGRNTSQEVRASGRVRRGDVSAQWPGARGPVQPGVRIELGQQSTEMSGQSSETLNVLDGGHAFISIGQSVPFSETWVTLMRRYAHVQETVSYREVSTGFSVHPRTIGDEVELEVAPRVASLSGGVVEFESLMSRVRVRFGEWFDLGGTMRSRDEVSQAILATGGVEGQRQSQVWVRVDAAPR